MRECFCGLQFYMLYLSYMTETRVADCAYKKYSLCRLPGGFPVVFIVYLLFHQSMWCVSLFSVGDQPNCDMTNSKRVEYFL